VHHGIVRRRGAALRGPECGAEMARHYSINYGVVMNYINHHPLLVYGITATLFFVLGFVSAKIHGWLSKELYG
jgi:hypothetical protein